MIINEVNNFRVSTILNVVGIDTNHDLIIHELGTDKGLAIEFKCSANNYIVVSFIKVKDGEAYLDWVRESVLEFNESDLLDWQYMCNEAIRYLNGILEVIK